MEKFNLLKNKSLSVLMMVMVAFFVSCGDDDEEEDTDEYGDWVERSVFDGNARGNAVSFTIDNKGYLVGGYDGSDYYKDVWVYDSESDFWDDLAPVDVLEGTETVTKDDYFPGGERSGAVAFSIGGKGYVGLGLDGDGNLYNDFYEFDPNAEVGAKWNQIADFPGTARSRAIGFALKGIGYVGTGNDGSDQKDFWEYDPTTDTWSEENGYGGNKRRNATVFVIEDVAYIGSGENNGSYLEDFYSFDGDTWTKLADIDDDADDDDDISVLVTNSVGFTIDGKGYFATGESGTVSSSVWEYTPSTDTWEQLASFEGSSREGASSFSFDNGGYVFGGYSSSSDYFDDMYQLYPGTIQED